MGELVTFPSEDARDRAVWNRAYLIAARELGFSDSAAKRAMEKIREHWEVLFEPVDLDLAPRPVPGKLSREQAAAIREIINAASSLVVDRMKHERQVAFRRLMVAELELAASYSGGDS